MTTVQQAAPTATEQDIPFGRLVAVEWRKMIDTRAGKWLLGITAGLVLVVMAIVLIVAAAEGSTISHESWFTEALIVPVSMLVPVVAILSVTSEWSQRTALVTFALEPRRLLVVLAKLVVVMGVAAATIGVAYVCSLAGNVLGASFAGVDPVWDLELSTLVWTTVLQVLSFLTAFGLAMLLLNTPAAIVIVYIVTFILPIMVYMPLVFAFDWARDLIPWLDLTHAAAPMMFGTDMTETPVDVGALEYAQFGFATLIWVVIPLALGLGRVLRAEIK